MIASVLGLFTITCFINTIIAIGILIGVLILFIYFYFDYEININLIQIYSTSINFRTVFDLVGVNHTITDTENYEWSLLCYLVRI